MTTVRHSEDEHSSHDLQRKLSNRHLQLIAIAVRLALGYLWVLVKPFHWQDLQFYLFT